jgi:hypothetical protein
MLMKDVIILPFTIPMLLINFKEMFPHLILIQENHTDGDVGIDPVVF